MSALPAPADPLDGLDDAQRTALEQARQRWAEPRSKPTDAPALRGGLRLITNDSKVLALRGRGELTPEEAARVDRLIADADAAEVRARRDLQAANRHASYLRNRPRKHAAASYEMLRPAQNPRGLVSSWWEKGPRVLVLAGSSRTGKSTAAYAVCNHAHAERAWVVSTTAVALCEACKPAERDRDVPASAYVPSRRDPDAFMRAAMCDLLLLDDLGRESVSDWWRSQVQELLDVRDREDRRTIITTNTSTNPEKAYEELLARYDDPVVERMFDGGGIVMFDGPPIRNLVTEW